MGCSGGCGWQSKESAVVILGVAADMIRCHSEDAAYLFLKILINISILCKTMYVMANSMTCF
jgi:hypothetical protein